MSLFFPVVKKNSEEKAPLKSDSFRLSGTINGTYSDFIYLNYQNVKNSVKFVNHKFEFKGSVDRPILGWLHLKHRSNIAWVYIENSDIYITSEYSQKITKDTPVNLLRVTATTGSYCAIIQNEYKGSYQDNKDEDYFNDLLYKKLQLFLENNRGHSISDNILGELALIDPILSKNELLYLYEKIDTTLQEQQDLEMIKIRISNLSTYGLNQPFLKFQLPDTRELSIDIDKFRNKITLVDFWASWCSPCREKHPDLIALKNKLDDRVFDIVNIYIDDNREQWLTAIDQDKLPWTHVLDQKKEVFNQLEIQTIPFN